MSTGDMRRLGRRPALDGLRGVAALVVVVSHALLTDMRWATSWVAVPASTGRAAVLLFFVLSGYVLTRPFLAGRGKAWRFYYPQRLVRLYVPVWGALLFATVLATVVPRVGGTGNWWLDFQAVPATGRRLLEHAALWRPVDFLDPLWSLQWEVAFSLLLPLYVVAARRSSGRLPLAFALLGLAHGTVWLVGIESATYLTVFGFGALLAAVPPVALGRWWAPVAATSLAALTSAALPVQVAGATGLLATALWCPQVARWFSLVPMLWLGRVSYSLYLVHAPIVLAVWQLGGGLAVTLPLAVGLSLLAARVFLAAVEAPSQRLAGRVRGRLAGSGDAHDPQPLDALVPASR